MPWDLINKMVLVALSALQDLVDDGILDRRALETDPLTELESWEDVFVRRLQPAINVSPSSTLGKECSVAGTYYDPGTAERAIIAVAESGNRGRDAFTALHELGHHIQHTTPEIADVLADLPLDISFAVEDRICERFSASLLIPNETATSILGAGTPTAGDIVALAQNTSASLQAVCVRASENFVVPGMVVLLDHEDFVQISPARGVPPPRRGSNQSNCEIVKRARRRLADGDRNFRISENDTTFEYRDGIRSSPMFAQVADIGSGHLVIVAVTEKPPWTAHFTLPKYDTGPRAPDRECPNAECGESFQSWTPIHDVCSQPECPACGRCGCAANHVKERVCMGCHLMLPNHFYEDDDATHCNDCA